MTVRQKAMLWWNNLSSGYKTQICDTNTELVGTVRRWETLTGREIEILYRYKCISDDDNVLKLNLKKYLDSKINAGGLYGLTISGEDFIPDLIKVIKLSLKNKIYNPPKDKEMYHGWE